MANVVGFGEHSNNQVQRAVLPRTESGYSQDDSRGFQGIYHWYKEKKKLRISSYKDYY